MGSCNSTDKPIKDIAVACIISDKQQVLCAKRLANNKAFPEYWEFPGGKVEANESIADALIRECREEIGITLADYQPLMELTHHYDEYSVCLHVWLVKQFHGEPKGEEGQVIRWLAVDELPQLQFLPANDVIIAELRSRYS